MVYPSQSLKILLSAQPAALSAALHTTLHLTGDRLGPAQQQEALAAAQGRKVGMFSRKLTQEEDKQGDKTAFLSCGGRGGAGGGKCGSTFS